MSDVYDHLWRLGHCLHWDFYENSRKMKQLVPSSALRRHGVIDNVLWFAPLKDMSEQNRYGNVTFMINFSTILYHFGDQFYNIDVMSFGNRNCERILLTKRSYPYKSLVDTTASSNAPIKISRHYWQCKKERSGIVNELELAIEVDSSDCAWLFNACTVQANNHSLANTQGFGRSTDVCQRYNHFCKDCPYPFTREETQEKLNALTY